MAKNFSDKYLAGLKPKAAPYTVREQKGFTLKVFPGGSKTFLFIYEVEGKRKQLNLGTYPYVSLADAREKYHDAVKAVAIGEPAVEQTVAEAPEAVLTFSELATKYISSCSHNTKKWRGEKESVLIKKFSEWKDKPITEITRREAYDIIDRELVNGKGAADHMLRTVRAMFEYAVERGYVVGSPFSRLKKGIPALKTKARTRFLTEREIPIVWKGIKDSRIGFITKKLLLTILITAQRPGEVAGLHRKEIEGDWWTIPAERALKGGRDHRVFLTETAKSMIGNTEEFIFPARNMNPIIEGSLSRVIKRCNYWGLEHFTPHDLRRTVRTNMSRLRIPREHSEAVLNHAKEGMVKIYDQYEYDDEKKEALQAWETELLRLVAHSTSSE